MSIIWRLTLTLYLRHVPFLGKSLEWRRLKNKTAALEPRTAVQFLPGEDGQLACLLVQMTMPPRRDAAIAPVWPGMVLPRR